MQIAITSLVGLAAILFSGHAAAAASGINCEGSGACPMFTKEDGTYYPGKVIDYIAKDINSINNDRHYNNGDHIACLPGKYQLNDGININGGICAFLQKTKSGANGGDLKRLIADLQQHKCKACGSVPTGFPGDNHVKNGMLTVNFVNNIGNCNGVC